MNHHQTAGVIQCRLAPDLSIEPSLKIIGHPGISREIAGGFTKKLTDLLLKAGFGGEFTVVAQTKVKGTPFTKGLHVKSPNARGATITWHHGSNDNNIQMLLCAPPHYDPMRFFSLIKSAEAVLAGEVEEEVTIVASTSVGAAAAAAAVRADVPTVTDVSPVESGRVDPVEPPAASKENSSEPLGIEAGYKYRPDPDAAELIVEELAKLADSNGKVAREHCRALLTGTFGFPTARLGPVYKSLISRGYLQPVDGVEESLRIGVAWMKKYFPNVAVTVAPPPEPITESAPVERSPQPQFREMPVAKLAPNPAAVEVQKLARRAQIAAGKRKRLGDIRNELTQLDELIRIQTERRTSLLEERGLLSDQLTQADLCDAEDRFAAIQRILHIEQ